MKEILDCVLQLASLLVNMFCQLLAIDFGPIGDLYDIKDATIAIIGILIIALVVLLIIITRND